MTVTVSGECLELDLDLYPYFANALDAFLM